MAPATSDQAQQLQVAQPKKAETTTTTSTTSTAKSYLASAVDSINPWGLYASSSSSTSRSATPTPRDPKPSEQPPPPASPRPPLPPTTGSHSSDHSTNPFYGQSLRRYPPDCPPPNVLWFHAADIPKRKPTFLQEQPKSNNGNNTAAVEDKEKDKKTAGPQPKKYVPFSASDSRAIEAAYQKKLQEFEDAKAAARKDGSGGDVSRKRPRVASGADEDIPNTSLDGKDGSKKTKGNTKVPVNEDFLFDVDIEERELGPVYWEGPVYDVRRGSWFYQEGSTLRPCEENLAAQLEEGYLKIRPWLYAERMKSETKGTTPMKDGKDGITPKSSVGDLKGLTATQGAADGRASGTANGKGSEVVVAHQPQTYRLFGAYMNSVATYQDANTAWLSSDGVLSWVTSTVYERFAGGGYMSGVKLVRGYTEPKKAGKEEKRPSTPTGTKSLAAEQDEKLQKALKRRSAPASVRSDSIEISQREEVDEGEAEPKYESTQARLTRQLSNLMEGGSKDSESEAIRKREEQEIQDDYNARQGETQNREIEHLVLVTHGIGQRLSLKMDSVNFVHDVNVMRKTLKTVYSASEDLRALNGERGENGPGNCRVQVLPVIWRHLLDFPKRKQKKGEHDLGDQFAEEDDYPTLENITIEGMAFARSLISDLALDVLLYQSAYREQIADIVTKESNRIYKLFMERNPNFKGKVHVVGHSLGSAILFDILCRQREKKGTQGTDTSPRNPLRFWPSANQDRYESKDPKDMSLEFEVEDFYCLGSPVGLFQMLKGRTIAARHLPNSLPSESPFNPDYMEDPFMSLTPQQYPYNTDQRVSPITGLPFSISSPKAAQLFNIFHPSDPIAYRLEPLISTAMSTLKPQVLPYTKKSIFGAVAGPQGLTGIGAKVGQSVSGLWSSFSAGIASTLLNQSLGLRKEDVAKFQQQQAQQAQQSPGAGTNITGGGVLPPSETALSDVQRSEKTAERMRQLANSGMAGGANGTISGNEATLLDDELETLYSRFQKKRVDIAKEKAASAAEGQGTESPPGAITAPPPLSEEDVLEEEKKAQKFRAEEMKVRALNRNGRVDYCIQESALDFNPLNTIACHMGYWADEDVSHFVLSQMLAASKVRTPFAGGSGSALKK
ncbi:phospholipase DDHD2 [Naviculisporaceae sp. PSN 640]